MGLFKAAALNGGWWGVGFKGLALTGGWSGMGFKGLALSGGWSGMGFKGLALNLDGLKPSACNEKVVKEDENSRRKKCFNPIPFFICSKKCHHIQKNLRLAAQCQRYFYF